MNPLVRTFGRQFGRPHGPLGRLAARLMRQGNAPLNRWMVDLLPIEPSDRILEVGFGPGVALAALLARASDGFVAGVDTSELMEMQRRHRRGWTAGRVVTTASYVFDNAWQQAREQLAGLEVWLDPGRSSLHGGDASSVRLLWHRICIAPLRKGCPADLTRTSNP